MNFSLKPHPLIAHWVPGFVSTLITLLAIYNWDYSSLAQSVVPTGTSGAFNILLLAVIAFVVGQALDAIRDLLENIWDIWWEVDWPFFFHGDKEKLENLLESYFTYYVFDCNLSLGIIITIILNLFSVIKFPPNWFKFWPAYGFLFFILNAIFLRKEMRSLLNEEKNKNRE